MGKRIVFILILMVSFVSCKKKTSNIVIAEMYYNVLNNSDYSKVPLLFPDSITTKEGDYKKVFSQSDYIEFLKWDSVFKPKYKFLEINEKVDAVFVKVSQKDKRIIFLNEEPIITNQVFRFKEGKISSIEIIDYIVFNDTAFIRNRTKLLNWVKENHPELNGFLYNQTENGGLKFLKAIELYQEAN
ncbi:hypothetical protein [Algibacter sp. R77976]|uniref:hypothetical protein n=1 Tax=Algibacter sp. R77976 TaxID=3093873 RepID=UPI0037C9B9C0